MLVVLVLLLLVVLGVVARRAASPPRTGLFVGQPELTVWAVAGRSARSIAISVSKSSAESKAR